MRIFSLLNEAELLIQATVSDLVRFVSLESLSLELCSAPEPAIVVGKVSQIDNKLADVVYAAGVRGVSVGLLPYDGQYPESLSRLLQPSVPIQDGAATIGLYSSRGLSFDFREPEHPVSAKLVKLKRKSEDEGRSTSPEDASHQITRTEFTALAIVTEGRQTYCLLGMGCLHPTISELELGRIAPRNVSARHWLLQSCHSPFVWPELGSYLTVPLSIALTSNAETVICSTHVQTYIPGLLNLYLERLSQGWTLGDIVRALNDHAASAGVDYRPFLLLGNPESRAIAATPSLSSAAKSATHVSPAQVTRRVRLLRRLIANVNFVSDEDNFGFDSKNDALSQFRRDMGWLSKIDLRSLSHFAILVEDIGTLLDGMRPPNEAVSLESATKRLSLAWEHQGGFYAVGERLDENYSPDGALQTSDRCLVCNECLIERRLSYFGQSPSTEYTERSQRICPRCLVVEHVSPVHRASTAVTAERTAHEMRIGLSYTNTSTEPQWVFAFAFLSDPNNVSKSTASDPYKNLLKMTANQRAQSDPRSLAPGETFQFEFSTGPIPDEFWYLLLEVNLMVDFCWNWYSFTFRERRIEAWLRSSKYPTTLPRAKPLSSSVPTGVYAITES